MNALHVSRSADLPPIGKVTALAELWAWSLPLALLGSWTCFGEVPGVNWALWTTAAAAGFLVVGRHSDRPHAGGYPRAALALACFLSIAAAITANPRADALIFLSVACLFAFAVLSTATRTGDIGPSALVHAPLDVCRLLLAEAAARIAETFAIVRMRNAIPVVRGSSMAAALAAVLFLLLSAADPTLADWRNVAWETVLSRIFLARDVFFVLLTLLLLGAYGLAARALTSSSAAQEPGNRSPPSSGGSAAFSGTSPPSSGGSPPPSTNAPPSHLSPPFPPAVGIRFSDLERLIVLGAALALFAVFFAAELSNQLGSAAARLPAGETFAEATHRGFGEMIIAAALCALVIITLDQRALRSGRERSVRLLSWGVIAASLVIVASAYQRVRFYEAAYGYTEQRLYVQVICGLVFLGLLSLAWELRSAIDFPRLIRHVALIGVACVAGLAYWNADAWIVNANVGRYASTGKLDVDYLERLARSSPDAIPALVEALPKLAAADASNVRASLQHASLDQSILMPPSGTGDLAWYEWSLRRAAARSSLRGAGLLGEAATH